MEVEPTVYRVGAGKCLTPRTAEAFGEYLAECADPDVLMRPWEGLRATLPKEHRLPGPEWQAWLALAMDLATDGAGEEREVGVILLRSEDAPHEHWRIMVPSQVTGAGALTYDLSWMADILTGETFDGIPEGWVQAGTSHSHHSMAAFYSRTDDRDELGIPGLHIVLGRVDTIRRTYSWVASVVDKGIRHTCDIDAFVVTDSGKHVDYNPSVRELIDVRAPVKLVLPASEYETRPRFWRSDKMEREADAYLGFSRDAHVAYSFSDSVNETLEALEALEEIECAASFLDRKGLEKALDILMAASTALDDIERDEGIR